VSIEASSTSNPILELPRDEQKETIKVEKPLEYSSHVISVHNSFLDEKLFENTQSDLPQSVDIWNHHVVGKIYSFWCKRRKDWCFKFKLKGHNSLAENVKLSAHGRHPTTYHFYFLFVFIFLVI
jgi:hypothetical protein